MKARSVLAVGREELWAQVAAVVDLDSVVEEELSPTERAVGPGFMAHADALRQVGLPVLVRHARRSAQAVQAARDDREERIEALGLRAQRLLWRAQRQARGGMVLGSRVWDPLFDARDVQGLLASGLVVALPSEIERVSGPFQLAHDLPAPPAVSYDFAEAVMPLTDDLSDPGISLSSLLHDLAALTAALAHHRPRRTHSGTLDKSTGRKLGKRLGDAALAVDGQFDAVDRWVRALRALELLGAVSMDPITRELGLEPGIEDTLAGTTAEAMDRLVHRLVDADLHAALPALRAALAQASDEAIDEMIFVEELCEQHRDVLHGPWHRDGGDVYPGGDGGRHIPFDEEGFERIEGRQIRGLLRVVERLGLLRRADGVFAATADGREWASGVVASMPPVWVSSDLSITVPPGAVTPWERYQLERLGRCTQRDVVDTYKLERRGLELWLATHDIDDALALLGRRCPALPTTVTQTLEDWARSAMRLTLTLGVVG